MNWNFDSRNRFEYVVYTHDEAIDYTHTRTQHNTVSNYLKYDEVDSQNHPLYPRLLYLILFIFKEDKEEMRNESLSEPMLGNRQDSRQQTHSRLESTSSFLVRRLSSVYENLPHRHEVIRDIVQVSSAKGADGDIPLPGGFASESRY